MSRSTLDTLIADGRTNAIASWLLVIAIAGIGLSELLLGEVLWTTFAATLLVLALLPSIAFRSPLVMLPWEVLLLAALPILGMALDAAGLTGHFASYLSVAAIALVLAVELQMFTTVRMTPGFAVIFVVVSTLSAAALWALLRWSIGGLLDTPFTGTHDEIMWEFVYSAVAGLGSGIVFEIYFRRFGRIDQTYSATPVSAPPPSQSDTDHSRVPSRRDDGARTPPPETESELESDRQSDSAPDPAAPDPELNTDPDSDPDIDPDSDSNQDETKDHHDHV
ncbi:hypothetical protein [Natrialba asiatica]|uniref:Uncharacterized protein n=1 Tax=Natrialba asiatica (strain ATCC 700177 / DSM 12278 / JCM 9576 / FERM P-10747 / NBRC 102637 / 172P1) TaxID=29540 RepID=M0ATU4_NATA1|nr:hypothetical protein [Natrialba asiatica]ELZ01358.1 hypothetical protein C481_10210 [Natrialba asiatica DSM 12278]